MLANLPANYKEEELEAQREADEYAKRSKRWGYGTAQPIREKLSEITSNPLVQTSLGISNFLLQNLPGASPLNKKVLPLDIPPNPYFENKSPNQLLGEKQTELLEGLADKTGVDPMVYEGLLLALPFLPKGLRSLRGLNNKSSSLAIRRTPSTSARTAFDANLARRDPAYRAHLDEITRRHRATSSGYPTPSNGGLGVSGNPAAKVKSNGVLPLLPANGATNGLTNGDEKTRMLEARVPLLAKLDEGINEILSQIAELPSKAKPGSVEALAITKLKKTITKLTRSKAAVIQTFYDDDMLARLYDNILSAAGISKEQELFFGRLKQAISIKGFNTPVHHNAWLKSFAEPFYNMDLGKGFDVQTILRDKHGRTLGDAMDNLTTFFDDKSHTLAHFGNTASTVLKEKLMNLDVTKMTAEEVADRIERIAQIADQQTGLAFNSKYHMEKGFELLESLPERFRKSLPSTLNPLDPSSPGWNELRLFWENADPDIKKLLNPDSQAMIERMNLDSMNIA